MSKLSQWFNSILSINNNPAPQTTLNVQRAVGVLSERGGLARLVESSDGSVRLILTNRKSKHALVNLSLKDNGEMELELISGATGQPEFAINATHNGYFVIRGTTTDGRKIRLDSDAVAKLLGLLEDE